SANPKVCHLGPADPLNPPLATMPPSRRLVRPSDTPGPTTLEILTQVRECFAMATAQSSVDPTTLDAATLLTVLKAVRKGDFTARLPEDWTGLPGKVADTFNEVVEMNERLAGELARLSVVVGRNGKIDERASMGPVTGAWSDAVTNVNSLVTNLAQPTAEAARVIGAVAKGDLSQTMALEIDDRPLEGEFMRTAKTVNRMVEQLGAFASEVTRVAREVGTEGKLGGQARVKGVAGIWMDLTESVNSMGGNLTA